MCSIDKLFIELGWESLQTKRNKHKLVTFYKIMHGLAPNYLSDLLPPIVDQTNNYALRNADHIQSFRSKTNLFSDSFFPSTIKAWNSLPNGAKELSFVLTFKNYSNRNKLQSHYYFHVGSRFGQILHARLRMQCSALNADLYCKKILLKALPVSTAEVLKVHITFSLHVPYMLLQEDISQPISTNTL